MKRITTGISGTGKYEICKNEHGYWAIEHAYLDKDGRLAKPINGIQGHLSDTKEEAIKMAIISGRAKEWDELNPNATQDERLMFLVTLLE